MNQGIFTTYIKIYQVLFFIYNLIMYRFVYKKSSLLQTGMQLLTWALLKRLYDTETREKTISTKNLQN